MKHNITPPIRIDSEVVCDAFGTLYKDTLKQANLPSYSYFKYVSTPFACMTLPFNKDGNLILNFEYRYPVDEVLLSCPGGLVEDGEDPMKSALRELLEETGFKSVLNL